MCTASTVQPTIDRLQAVRPLSLSVTEPHARSRPCRSVTESITSSSLSSCNLPREQVELTHDPSREAIGSYLFVTILCRGSSCDRGDAAQRGKRASPCRQS